MLKEFHGNTQNAADRLCLGNVLKVCEGPGFCFVKYGCCREAAVGELHPGSAVQDLQGEDADGKVAYLGVLVLHLDRVPTVPGQSFFRARTGLEVTDPSQGACRSRSRTPAHASQEQAAPQER